MEVVDDGRKLVVKVELDPVRPLLHVGVPEKARWRLLERRRNSGDADADLHFELVERPERSATRPVAFWTAFHWSTASRNGTVTCALRWDMSRRRSHGTSARRKASAYASETTAKNVHARWQTERTKNHLSDSVLVGLQPQPAQPGHVQDRPPVVQRGGAHERVQGDRLAGPRRTAKEVRLTLEGAGLLLRLDPREVVVDGSDAPPPEQAALARPRRNAERLLIFRFVRDASRVDGSEGEVRHRTWNQDWYTGPIAVGRG